MTSTVEETLARQGSCICFPRGISMWPILRNGIDSVLLVPVTQVKKHDAVLFRRENGQGVLHRVRTVGKDGYGMCGDGQWQVEYPVPREKVVAVVAGYYRREKFLPARSLRCRLYVLFWCKLQPLWLRRRLLALFKRARTEKHT